MVKETTTERGEEVREFAFDAPVAIAAAGYLVARVPALTRYPLSKLLYLAEKYHLIRYGQPLIGGEYRALNDGPVQQTILDLFKDAVRVKRGLTVSPYSTPSEVAEVVKRFDFDLATEHEPISVSIPPDLDELSESRIEALDWVIQNFPDRSYDGLWQATHAMRSYLVPHARATANGMATIYLQDFFEDASPNEQKSLQQLKENQAVLGRFPAPSF